MKVNTLFGEEDTEWWKEYWHDMPEYSQDDLEAVQSITVNFLFKEDVADFAKLLETCITPQTRGIWFPRRDREEPKNFLWVTKP